MSESPPNKWSVRCNHPNYISKGIYHDFSSLAVGASDVAPAGATQSRWLGGFSGRPGLLSDLMPYLAPLASRMAPQQASSRRTGLILFWRFLDGYETFLEKQGVVVKRVERLHHITALHIKNFSLPGPNGSWRAAKDTRSRTIRSLIREAVVNQDIDDVFMPPIPDVRIRKETPPDEVGLELIAYLRKLVAHILIRWRRADQLASRGRNLLEVARDPHPGRARPSLTFVPTEADAHATYRALITATGNTLPTTTDLCVFTGVKMDGDLPSWWPRYPEGHRLAGSRVRWYDVVSGLYPSGEDVALMFLLFLARSAWNPSVTASISIDDWHAPYDSEHCWIFAPKARSGGALQWTISTLQGRTSCYSLVSALALRAEPLRHLVIEQPDLANLPDVAARSPWLGVTVAGHKKLYSADPQVSSTINNRLRSAIAAYNRSPEAKLVVPDMTAGDFRDIAAAIMYKKSKYSLWVLHVLLGHKSLRTSRDYGFRMSSFRESFNLVRKTMDDVLEQIAVHRKFDITITRARLAGHKVSKQDIARLMAARKARTYDGCGCADRFHPPVEIDPTNPQDGCTTCIQQHRCAASGCRNAFVFSDSLPYLCRRVAELEFLREQVGLVRFEDGSESSDLRQLLATLKQWREPEVRMHVRYWADKLADGSHKPIQFAGQHK